MITILSFKVSTTVFTELIPTKKAHAWENTGLSALFCFVLTLIQFRQSLAAEGAARYKTGGLGSAWSETPCDLIAIRLTLAHHVGGLFRSGR